MRGLLWLGALTAAALVGIFWYSLSSQSNSSEPTPEASTVVQEARRELGAADSLEGEDLVHQVRLIAKRLIANRSFTESEVKRIKLALLDAEEILSEPGLPVEIRRSVLDEFLQTLESI